MLNAMLQLLPIKPVSFAASSRCFLAHLQFWKRMKRGITYTTSGQTAEAFLTTDQYACMDASGMI